MNNLRKYGIGPFSVAVIHGGPGASGSMAPVAKEYIFCLWNFRAITNICIHRGATPGIICHPKKTG
jgi:hypothetical protein